MLAIIIGTIFIAIEIACGVWISYDQDKITRRYQFPLIILCTVVAPILTFWAVVAYLAFN